MDLASFCHGNRRLLPMRPGWAVSLGEVLAGIDPWLRLGYAPATLARYLAADNPQRLALAVLADDLPAACLTVRPDWLRGPLLELLAVLPSYQSEGLGKALVHWLAEDTRKQGQANVWTIASEFNQAARAFYRRQGFVEVGLLDGLIRPGENEILLRLSLDERS
jgi:GNAT superfamily N-acetyltransferase